MIHPELIAGAPGSPLLIVADHASNAVPPGVDLEIDHALLEDHIAIDIGSAALSRALAAALGAPAILAGVSRLVIDLNRELDAAGLIPEFSDGWTIPGNVALHPDERARRIHSYYDRYHDAIARHLDRGATQLIISVHSFTPQLASRADIERPWPVGVLYNSDDRAARLAIDLLRAAGHLTGDNEPYSGRHLNATMNRHAEARGLPYLGFEVRQDEIDSDAGVARWAEVLEGVVRAVARAVQPPVS